MRRLAGLLVGSAATLEMAHWPRKATEMYRILSLQVNDLPPSL